MPRLLQSVLDRVARAKLTGTPPLILPARRKRRVSLYKQLPPRPSFKASDYTESILLAEQNPIIHKHAFTRHKRLPPRVMSLGKHNSEQHGEDTSHEMTDSERVWWSDPYLRMLSSPIRKCNMTGRHLPSAFLVRLATMNLPANRASSRNPMQVVVPDGLEHPKFKLHKSGKAFYILCRRAALYQLADRGTYKKYSPRPVLHSLIADQISHLLRVRALQELELLIDKLRPRFPRAGDQRIVRVLTRGELKTIKESGIVNYPNAVAVIVVPQPNRNPLTKERPSPSLSTLPPEAPFQEEKPRKPLLPLSVLYDGENPDPYELKLPSHSMMIERVPLYNGIALMPTVQQRAALHQSLTILQSLEKRKRKKSPQRNPQGEDRPSHAFLLTSDSNTIKRADVVDLAIALWRIRLFEGGGWDDPDDVRILPG